MSDLARLVDAFGNLVGTVIWPALVLFLILRFRAQLSAVVDDVLAILRSRDFTMKAGPSGVELTAGGRVARALLEEADASRADGPLTDGCTTAEVRDAVGVLEAQSHAQRERSRARLLWVDDRPENNRLVQRAFREIGIDIDLATSTEEALRRLAEQGFDVVVSDMGRPPDRRAGYTLLDEMRRRGDHTPFVIYAGSRTPEHVEEAQQHGAVGATNRAGELVQLVAQALVKNVARGDRGMGSR